MLLLDKEDDSIDDINQEEKPLRIQKKYEVLATDCHIQRKINFGDYNNLFRDIEERKYFDKHKFDIVFFYFCVNLFRNNIINETIKEESFDKIRSINTNNFNMLFYNFDGFYEIDESVNMHNIKRKDQEEKHHIYDIKVKNISLYNDIHFITCYKIIKHVHSMFFSSIINQRFFSKNTLIYYLNIIDLIITKRDMCEEIFRDYPFDYTLKHDFNLFLIKFKKSIDINKKD